MKQNLQIVELTYLELKAIRDLGQLSAGQHYRITDYVTTSVQNNTKSAGHPFDLIVMAIDKNTLSEQAAAMLNYDDVYFRAAVADLNTWKVWYCLDNDTKRFKWADQENGKGVIYRMIDEWNNDVPYDFKNILFMNDDGNYVFTFGNDLSGGCNNNHIEISIETEHMHDIQVLNYNILGCDCYDNYFDSCCCFNELGDDCYANIMGWGCNGNHWSNSCHNNHLGDCSDDNNFGSGSQFNRFGDKCSRNNLGENCCNNTFGSECIGNCLDNNCCENKFGNRCTYNELGHRCISNKLGDDSGFNQFLGCCSSNTIGQCCGPNFFGNCCHKNKMDDRCNNNSFGQNCCNNILYNNCDNNSFGSNCCNNEVCASDCCNNWFEEGVDSVVILLPWGSNPRFYVASSVKDDIIILDDRKDEPILIAMTTDGTVEQFSSLEMFNSPRNKILYDADYYNAVVLHLDDIDDEEMA